MRLPLHSPSSLRSFATIVLLVASVAASGSAAGEKPYPSDSFADMVGLDSKFGRRSTPDYLQWPAMRDALVASGVRHLREGVAHPNAEYLERMAELGRHGINHSGAFDYSDLFKLGAPYVVSDLKQQMPYVDFVEAGNEVDGSHDPDWPTKARQAQQILYDAVKSQPEFSHVVVLAPSLLNPMLGSPQIAGVPSDVVGVHDGTCNDLPTTKERSASIVNAHKFANVISPGRPIWATESGYDNDPGKGCYISEKVGSIYLIRTLAERYNSGERRVYFNTFADQPQDRGFRRMGLVDENARPKPQYYAIRSLISLLADPGPGFDPKPFDYSFESVSPDVHHTLLQKRDGTTYLLLWIEKAIWSRQGFYEIPVPDQTAEIRLPSNATRAKLYTYKPDFTLASRDVPISGGRVTIPVTTTVAFLEVR